MDSGEIKDFPISEELFNAQMGTEEVLISTSFYNANTQEELNKSQAQRILINKDLEIIDRLNDKEFGLIRANSDVKVIGINEDSDQPWVYNVAPQALYSDKSNIGPINLSRANFKVFEISGGFMPFNKNVYEVQSKMKNKNGEFEIGDKWYSNKESLERNGFNENYNVAWIFGIVNKNNIAENLTDFATCLSNQSYDYCSKTYTPWFKDCPSSSSKSKIKCKIIKKNLKNLASKMVNIQKDIKQETNKTLKDQVDHDEVKSIKENLLINTCLIGSFGVILTVFVIIEIHNYTKNKKEKGFQEVTNGNSLFNSDSRLSYTQNS